MAAAEENKQSIASELLALTKRVEYTSMIRTLKDNDTVMIADYPKMDISQWFELDTSKCFLGKRKFKINPHCLYDIFAGYCKTDKFVLKDMARKEIENNWQWYSNAAIVCLGWKSLSLMEWFKWNKFKKTPPDEIMLYALCVLFRRHAIVFP